MSNNKTKIGTLWFGKPLTKIQEISLSSFVFYGHDISIFLYDKSIKVPDGVKKLNANEIIPLRKARFESAFSDIFRLKMMQITDMHWVDADTICISKNWFDKDDIYFIKQENGQIQCPVSKFPKNSEILKFLIEQVENIDITKSEWTDTNSKILTRALEIFPEYKKYLIEESLVNGVTYEQYWKFFDPMYKDEILNFKKDAKSVTPFNGMLTLNSFDKNNLPNGSAIKYFYDKFVLKENI